MNNFQEICKNFPNVDNIILISESNLDASRKTFLYNNFIIKAHKKNEDLTQHMRQNSFQREYELLKECNEIGGVPKTLYYCYSDDYDLLFMSYQQGIQLVNLKISFVQLLKILKALSVILFKLSRRGISHNDIVPENILVTNDFKVSLIDFDQATKVKIITAFVRQFLGIKIGDSKLNYSMITIIKDYLRKKFPQIVFLLKKLSGKKFPEIERLPTLNENADPKLKKLLRAWILAQKSNASSPGIPIAYYSLEFNGIRFPGERPWIKRWDELKNISDYSGKTIIELGCNMGLLSTFLLKEANAKKCIAVDGDKKILRSAEIISNVLQVKPEYLQINFDSNDDWEAKLYKFEADLIFALNVLNWVKDKGRFLSFLSKAPEVIFEGHDLPEIEKARFLKLGFTNVEEIGYSERKRIILRCRK